MKLGPVTKTDKIDKKNKTASKKIDNDVISENCDVSFIFPIYGQFGAIRKLDSGRTVWRLKFSLIVTFYLTKTEKS